MSEKSEGTNKQVVVNKWGNGRKYWMAEGEYIAVIAGKESTNSEYVISDGVIKLEGFVPDHYHEWEDQTFHVIEGRLDVKIGEQTFQAEAGDCIHCPRGVSHYMKNIGESQVRLFSYIFPGDWAEDFFAETSRQNHSGEHDFEMIEEKFGVVYI